MIAQSHQVQLRDPHANGQHVVTLTTVVSFDVVQMLNALPNAARDVLLHTGTLHRVLDSWNTNAQTKAVATELLTAHGPCTYCWRQPGLIAVHLGARTNVMLTDDV